MARQTSPQLPTIEVRERADGGITYRVCWRYPGERGLQRFAIRDDKDMASRLATVVAGRGRKVRAADPEVVSLEIVTGVPAETDSPTLRQVIDKVIATRTGATKESRDTYRSIANNDLAPLLDRTYSGITDTDTRGLLMAIADNGRSPASAYDLLKSVSKYAAAKNLFGDDGDPMYGVKRPQYHSLDPVYLTAEEFAVLDKVSSDSTDPRRWGVNRAIHLTCGSGLRKGEVLGLQVRDVRRTTGRVWLNVVRQWTDHGHYAPLKGRAARRVVLDDHTGKIALELAKGRGADAPLLLNPYDLRRPWSHATVQTVWNEIRSAAQAAGLVNLPRYHDLRHTHAAWLLTAGVSLLAVSRRLGHKTIAITADTYGHLLPESDDAILAAMDTYTSQYATAA